MPDDDDQSPPNPSQAAPAGETTDDEEVVGEPAALPRSYTGAMFAILVLLALIFLVTFLFTRPSQREPLPATPPADLKRP